ncbi:uncharacterized protein LOC117339126 [Pecten maximus]|uniref:uncharacterized protein LOC117339126 n=1 Tax=Pecten maximus TaxID=6579 RepID=UPI0014581DBD|nr:uncharacterized protein LOC117339126 [Pecten maximus]
MEGTTLGSFSHIKHFMKGLTLVIMLSSAVSASAFLTEEKWRRPCGVSNGPIAGSPGGPPTHSPDIILAGMLPILQSAITAAESLKHKYISERLTARRVPNLDTFHFDGMPDVTMTTSEIEESLVDINLAHMSNYKKLSKVLVFLEQVRFDETFMDSSIDTYKEEVQEIEIVILNVMCVKQRLIQNAGAQIDHISHTEMSQDIRVTANDHERHERDYVIVKDTFQLLETMHVHVTAINNQMRQSQ